MDLYHYTTEERLIQIIESGFIKKNEDEPIPATAFKLCEVWDGQEWVEWSEKETPSPDASDDRVTTKR
jgi:hypothetical protein